MRYWWRSPVISTPAERVEVRWAERWLRVLDDVPERRAWRTPILSERWYGRPSTVVDVGRSRGSASIPVRASLIVQLLRGANRTVVILVRTFDATTLCSALLGSLRHRPVVVDPRPAPVRVEFHVNLHQAPLRVAGAHELALRDGEHVHIPRSSVHPDELCRAKTSAREVDRVAHVLTRTGHDLHSPEDVVGGRLAVLSERRVRVDRDVFHAFAEPLHSLHWNDMAALATSSLMPPGSDEAGSPLQLDDLIPDLAQLRVLRTHDFPMEVEDGRRRWCWYPDREEHLHKPLRGDGEDAPVLPDVGSGCVDSFSVRWYHQSVDEPPHRLHNERTCMVKAIPPATQQRVPCGDERQVAHPYGPRVRQHVGDERVHHVDVRRILLVPCECPVRTDG